MEKSQDCNVLMWIHPRLIRSLVILKNKEVIPRHASCLNMSMKKNCREKILMLMTKILFSKMRPASLFKIIFFQAEDGIRDLTVTGVQTCALPICRRR